MKKTGFIVLSLIFVFVMGCSTSNKDSKLDIAKVSFVIGDVTKNGIKVNIGDPVMENDELITTDKASCDITIGESIIRVKQKSKVKFTKLIKQNDLENTTLNLEVGKMLCKPKRLMKDESFMVKTPTAVAGVRGTKFTVEADEKSTTRIKVYDGKVKVVKRLNIKTCEDNIEAVLESSAPIEKSESVVITEKQVKASEKVVEAALKKEGIDPASTAAVDEIKLVKVMTDIKKDSVISKKDIQTFKVEEFTGENQEIIEVVQKPKEVLTKIAKIVEEEKKTPKPDGQLLVTRFEIYFIKDGNVVWEGKLISDPVKSEQGDKLFIASGDYVFCASVNGPVLWKQQVKNDGKLELKGDKVMVYDNGKIIKEIDVTTGL